MCIGAAMFGLTVWAVLLALYANGREASQKDLTFGNREPLSFPEGEFALQPVYTQVSYSEPERSTQVNR
tara:strand:- start:167 stop:373 length:207 start_codon:yes stop_codon:yes gene_type:complete